jgi:CRP/FNR family cyclic AMP-dependent transcriptional regulator
MYPIASEESYEDGQVIFNENTAGDWVYVVLNGSVEISKTIRGNRFIITMLEQGEVFGELGYLGDINRTATARAIGETTIGIIDRVYLDKEFNLLSSAFRTILVAVVQRFRNLIERTCAFSSRKEERVQRSLSVAFKDRHSFVRAFTGNISNEGLFIRTEQPLNKGERFSLNLKLPDFSEPIKATCEVVWTRGKEETEKRPPGMGVRFCEISEEDRQLLSQYIRTLIGGG